MFVLNNIEVRFLESVCEEAGCEGQTGGEGAELADREAGTGCQADGERGAGLAHQVHSEPVAK